jgi:hypothetical protein
MEFSLLILKQMINLKQQMKKVMVNLWRHFDISNTVSFSDSYLNFETLLEITFKVELNGFIKAMEKLEKKIKIQDSKALGLIETDGNKCLDENKKMSPRTYFKNGNLSVIYAGSILNNFDSFIDALCYLFGLYFCFDLIYPNCFKQSLGLVHQFYFPQFKNADVKRNVGFVNLSLLME